MSMAAVPERTRISADRYQKMVATGVLTKYDRVELIDGDILDMPPSELSHSAVVARLNKLFVMSVGDFYAGHIAMPPDVLLLVEVSDSSLAFDLGAKRTLYARHGVTEYWVADIPGKRVHVYREPTVDGYAWSLECTLADTVSPR
jgi:Uma2 family endonuclease